MDPIFGSPSPALLQKKVSFKNEKYIPSSHYVAKLILQITELGFVLKKVTFTHAFNKKFELNLFL